MKQKSWRASLLLAIVAWVTPPAFASASGVVISQVFGGNGSAYTSDLVELFNAGAAPVSLAGWSLQYASASGSGTFAGNSPVALSAATLQPGQYHLIRLATSGTGATLPTADTTAAAPNIGSTGGKLALVNTTAGLACNGSAAQPCSPAQLAQIVDLVGYGAANFFEGASAAPAPTASTAVVRSLGGCTDSDQNGTDFSVGSPNPRNSASPLSACGGPAAIVPVCPAALSVAIGTPLDTLLTASDSDSLVYAASFLSGNVAGMSLSGFIASPAPGGNASVSLSLSSSVAAGTYPVVVQFANGDGQTANCSVNISVVSPGTFTPIHDLQGSGNTSPLPGVRTTRGVVTKLNNNGYYLQDPVGDGNPLTSDGIFVFTSAAPTVSVGQLIQVTGTVTEFNTGAASNPITLANTVTEIASVTSTTVLGTGSVTPTVITLPVATLDELERYEGMLVSVNTALTASQNFFQGRYGQVTLSAGGRLVKPTNRHRPGTPAALAEQDLNARSSLMLDDGTSQQNPNPTPYIGADNTLRAGDALPAGITGVIDYGLATNDNGGKAMYRIHPTVAPVFTRLNNRSVAPPAVGGNVKVASFNVLNFFTTFTDGTNAAGQTGQVCTQGTDTPSANLCRGADNLGEFTRQRAKIVEAMAAIGADVFGLMEIQNNGNTAALNLVTALNAVVGAGTYAVVPPPPSTGTDAIRVAMIYKPGRLGLSGASASDTNAVHNRPPLAQTFSFGAEKFSVVVNHFKSKGSCPASSSDPDADQGDGQGCWNELRKQQASALLSFIGSVQAAAADNDVLVIGDLNAYGVEDPIDVLTSAGLIDQVSRFDASGYSYVFDGEAGYLDHGLATPSLSAQITGTTHWHVNADEPSIIDYNTEFKQPLCATCGPDYYSASAYRASDHDPVVIGLNLPAPLPQTISFTAPADRAVNAGSFTATATASSGLAVSFATTTPAVCSTTPVGLVTLNTTGLCTLTANQAGNASFAAAPTVTRSFNVTAALLAQTISFAPLSPRAVNSGPFPLTATASSGLTVSFSSLTSAVCAVSGNTVSLLAVGTCTVAANQAGNATYLPAGQASQSFSVTTAVELGDGDIPTLPEWGAILLGLMLLTLGMRSRPRDA
jgi:uncharacterized protein